MKKFNELNKFKNLKFHSVIPQDILQAVKLLEKLGYETGGYFSADDAVKHNGVCAWDDGEITEGWLDNDTFEQVTLEDLKKMVSNEEEVLWLNKETLEEHYLDKFSVFPYNSSWVEVPEGATFATGDKDSFVFRKDGWYYEDGLWVETSVLLKHFPEYKYIKLFWIKSEYLWDVGDNKFTLERLLGCEVKLFGERFYLNENNLRNIVCICNRLDRDLESGLGCLTFFTEDGDEVTFDEYVKLYYGDTCV